MRKTDQLLESIQVTSHSREVLADTIRLLWRRRWFVAGVTVSFSVVAAIVSLLLPASYESTTRLLPAPSSSPMGEMSRMLQMGAPPLLGDSFGVVPGQGRFIAILHSRILADHLVDRFGLMKLYGAKYRQEARKALANHTNILEDRKTGVITITVLDKDPRRAADLAGGYAKELETLNAEMNTSGAHMEAVFLDSRVAEIQQELHEAAIRLSQFSTKYSIVDASEQPKSTVDAALKLQGQLIAAQSDLKGLEQIYTSYSPKVQVAKAKVDELTRQFNQMRGSQPSVSAPTDGTLPSIRNLPTLGVTYAELAQKAKLLQAVQVALTQQLELAKTEEVKQLPAFRVMDPPEVPEQRSFPRRTQIVIVSSLVGLFAAIAMVLAASRWAGVSSDDPIKLLFQDAKRAVKQRPSPDWQDQQQESPALSQAAMGNGNGLHH